MYDNDRSTAKESLQVERDEKLYKEKVERKEEEKKERESQKYSDKTVVPHADPSDLTASTTTTSRSVSPPLGV
jgi:hypothetical protein